MSAAGRKRRNSGGGAPGSKAVKVEANTDLKVPVDALLKGHVKNFDQWLMLGYCRCNNYMCQCVSNAMRQPCPAADSSQELCHEGAPVY